MKLDLRNKEVLDKVVKDIGPNLIIHLAAESHVDRSIDNPLNFIESNIVGTFNLLEATRAYWEKISDIKKNLFTKNLPDPDILVRTGGHKRLSNFEWNGLTMTERGLAHWANKTAYPIDKIPSAKKYEDHINTKAKKWRIHFSS